MLSGPYVQGMLALTVQFSPDAHPVEVNMDIRCAFESDAVMVAVRPAGADGWGRVVHCRDHGVIMILATMMGLEAVPQSVESA